MNEGKLCWYDYLARDVSAAISFYGEVLGWKPRPWGDDGYQMFMVDDEHAVGGVAALPADSGARPHWEGMITTDDADATAAKCEELGGEVLRKPWDLPGVGRIAVLRDPHGAVFGVSALEEEMATVPPETPGAFSWAELWAGDVDEAFEFYSALFGWEKGDSMEMGSTGTYQMFEADGATIGGMMTRPEGLPMAMWTYCITTDDLEAAITRVESHDGSIMNGPMDVPRGRVCYCSDNQGAMFALYEFTS